MGTMTIDGAYASAAIFTAKTHTIEDYALSQLQMICDNPAAKDAKIRVMPDVHPGKIGPIGLTMTVTDTVLPGLVGIDAGCGMTMAQITGKVRDFQKLDTVIREKVPSCFSVRKTPHRLMEDFDFSELYCRNHINLEKARLSAGTLGSGNHFIEVDQDEENHTYLTIHSGSRHPGKEVSEYYMKEGQKQLQAEGITVPYELTYLSGKLKEQYLHDLMILTEYAAISREIMINEICRGMKWKVSDLRTCIHNYIDTRPEMIRALGAPLLRKGAVSALSGETVIIPVNMHDGILLGTGLGNKEFNCSAPHGSGRIYKREDVKNHYTVSSFKTAMKGIYSTCISRDTLDEAPFAYRGMEEMLDVVEETVHIEKILHPLYNFKAG